MRFSRAVFSCYIFEGYGQTESTSATSVSHPVVCIKLLLSTLLIEAVGIIFQKNDNTSTL